jgi:hypothetical protein
MLCIVRTIHKIVRFICDTDKLYLSLVCVVNNTTLLVVSSKNLAPSTSELDRDYYQR